MTSDLVKRADPSRYLGLLRLAAGAPVEVSVFDASGAPVWTDGHRTTGVGQDRKEIEISHFALDGDEAIAQPCLDGATLIYAGISSEDGEQIGWLACRVPPPDEAGGRSSIDRCRAALAEVARCLEQDLRVGSETTGLVDELAARNEELNLVYSFAREDAPNSRPLDSIRRVLSGFADSLSIDLAALVLPGEPELTYTSNFLEPAEDLQTILVQLRGALYHFVEARRKALVINEENDARRNYLLWGGRFRLLAYPVLRGGSMLAMLVLLRHPQRAAFSAGDRNLAGAIVRQAAILLHGHTVVEKMQEFGAQLALTLAEAVEARDPHGHGHAERVEALSQRLGRALGLGDADLESLRWVALLHDVGKIVMPDFVLLKRGTLSEDEQTFLRMHPERGFQILRRVEHLGPAVLDAVRYHEEHFDGRGYPHGLSGDAIPKLARILAVVNAFDASLSEQARGGSHPVQGALATLGELAGTRLDPEVVKAFEALWREDAATLERALRGHGLP